MPTRGCCPRTPGCASSPTLHAHHRLDRQAHTLQPRRITLVPPSTQVVFSLDFVLVSVLPSQLPFLLAGYGRLPTAYVYTSADTVLPTTHYQTPLAAFGPDACGPRAAAQETPSARLTGRGRLLQAFTFSSASGSSTHSSSARSCRTLLYTRGGTSWGPARQSAMPSVDLLDRMTLLRRLAPATEPAARPPQLAAGVALHPGCHHFTPAPRPTPLCRWAWDDCQAGLQSGAGGSSLQAAPIAHVPAPGWRCCGEVVAAAATAGGQVSVMVAQGGGGCGRSSPLAGSAATGSTAEKKVNGGSELVVMLCSPRAHQLGTEECEGDGEDLAGPQADSSACSSQGSSKPPFRPPGPLQHKHGNRPRPRTAPSAAEQAARQAKAAGLRECGCPRSPGGSADAAGHGAARVKQLRWQDEAWGPQDAAAARRVAPAAEATTTTVEVSTGPGSADVILISSPTAAVGLEADGRGDLLVACASPRCAAAAFVSGAAGGGDVEVTLSGHEASPPAACWSQAGGTATPPRRQAAPAARHPTEVGHGCGSDASSAAEGDWSHAAAGIKAWRSAPAPGPAHAERPGATWAGRGLAMELEVLLSDRAALGTTEELEEEEERRQELAAAEGEEGERRHAQAQLHLLSGEMRRRERSLGQLLAELERISLKCSALTAAAGAAAGGADTRAAARTQEQGTQQPPLHTTLKFSTGPPAQPAMAYHPAPRQQPSAAARPGSSAPAAAAEACQPAEDWSWEGLLELERRIRERQHKVRQEGCLGCSGVHRRALPHAAQVPRRLKCVPAACSWTDCP